MIIKNPLKLNDWEFKKFIRFILIIQFSLWGLITLDFFGINIPILRELIGFVYIVFLPGALVLRILKLHNLSNTETLLYSVSISLTISMFVGVLISLFYPFLGILKPLSFLPIMTTMAIVIGILCSISYKIDKDYSGSEKININEYLTNKYLFLFLIPILSIVGSFFINYYSTNIITALLIILIVFVIILVGFNKIPKKMFPLCIFLISIALLFHNSLISSHIIGFDIQREYYVANVLLTNFKWELIFPPNLSFFTDANSILSITTLPVMFHYVCGIDLIWIFKLFYPLLFSLVPLGLYSFFKKQTNNKIAFFACVYFISSYVFFYNMIKLMRQIVGEIFLVAILLLIFDKIIDKRKRSLLLVLFLFSLTVSHYGLVYIFLAIIVGVYILQYILNKLKNYKNDQITLTYVLLFITFVLAWYIYNSHSSVFISIVGIFDNVASNIATDFLNPVSAQGLGIIVSKQTLMNTITKNLYLITHIFIIIGITGYLFNFGKIFNKIQLEKEYFLFACCNLFILLCSIALPNFSKSLDTTRIIHISLIFIAPFAIIGFLIILEKVSLLLNLIKKFTFKPYKIISIFFVIFLLLNVGIVHEIFKEPYKPTMVYKTVNDPPIFNEIELTSAKWAFKYTNNSHVYGDTNSFVLLNGFIGPNSKQLYFSLDTMSFLKMKNNSYIYLRTKNLEGILLVPQYMEGFVGKEDYLNKNYLNSILVNKNKIYDDGSNIFL